MSRTCHHYGERGGKQDSFSHRLLPPSVRRGPSRSSFLPSTLCFTSYKRLSASPSVRLADCSALRGQRTSDEQRPVLRSSERTGLPFIMDTIKVKETLYIIALLPETLPCKVPCVGEIQHCHLIPHLSQLCIQDQVAPVRMLQRTC